MVEVEHDDIRLSAVDARMSAEILADKRTILVAIATDPRDFLPDICVPIEDVMLAPVFRVTAPTATLASASRLAGERERLDRLGEPAVIATLGLDGCDGHEGPLRSGSALRSA
jgi:hypothetical protein